jgi:hypothetical protein
MKDTNQSFLSFASKWVTFHQLCFVYHLGHFDWGHPE